MVKRLVGPESLNTMEGLFKRAGPWAIVLTRSLPYSVPEALVLLAGLARMPLGKFTAALAVGSVPTAFVFAAIGAGWADQPILAVAVSYVLPILLLPIALYLMRLRPSSQMSSIDNYTAVRLPEGCASSTKSGDARAGPIHSRTFAGTSGSHASARLGTTCRG